MQRAALMEECERWQSNRSPKCKGRPALRPDLVIVEGHQLVAVDAVARQNLHRVPAVLLHCSADGPGTFRIAQGGILRKEKSLS